jgi:hypothetical protein
MFPIFDQNLVQNVKFFLSMIWEYSKDIQDLVVLSISVLIKPRSNLCETFGRQY